MTFGDRRFAASLLLLLLGCAPSDMAEEWQLDRLRLLAIRAEPAEPQPGDTVTFTSLAYVPGDVPWSAIWLACVAGSDSGCEFDASVLEQLGDLETMTPEEQAAALAALQEAGFIGFEPLLAPVWSVPEDALDGLTDDEALEGISGTVQVTLTTETETELVLKQVPVSRAATPNHNPDIGTFTVDEVAIGAGAALTLTAGQSYDLSATLAEGALETYTYRTSEGVDEERTEETSWRWYTDNGALAYDGFSFTDDTPEEDSLVWTPESEGAGVLHAVVLDGRGGMGWWSVSVTVDGSGS